MNALTKFGRNALHIATLRGHVEVVKVLCLHKIDWDAADLEGNTALHFAAEGGYKEIIIHLLSVGCVLRKNRDKLTPIDDCCDESLKKIFEQNGFKENGDYEIFQKNKVNKL